MRKFAWQIICAVGLLVPTLGWSGQIQGTGFQGYTPPANCGSSGNVLTSGGDCTTSWSGTLTTASSDIATLQTNVSTLQSSMSITGMQTSSTTAAISAAATTVWGNVASVTVSSGTWDLYGIVNTAANGGTVTNFQIVISSNSGTGAGDHVSGNNLIDLYPPIATTGSGGAIPVYRVTTTGNTAYYLKAKGTFTVATPTVAGRLTAVRWPQ